MIADSDPETPLKIDLLLECWAGDSHELIQYDDGVAPVPGGMLVRGNGDQDDDTINGGAGNDYLDGGAGNDTYVFRACDGRETINKMATIHCCSTALTRPNCGSANQAIT